MEESVVKLKIKVGDLVRCLGGIEGPPEVVGTGLVLEEIKDKFTHMVKDRRFEVKWAKSSKPWKMYEEDLEVIHRDK